MSRSTFHSQLSEYKAEFDQLTRLVVRVLFWIEMVKDIKKAFMNAMLTVNNTDVDEYRDLNEEMAYQADEVYQFRSERLKTAKNDLKTYLNKQEAIS